MRLTSPAFLEGGTIPSKYTCDNQEVSPPLDISGVPSGTKSLVLIMDDPDAPMGTWDHWIVWNIPPDTTRIVEGKNPKGVLGKNTGGRTSYQGPCPPDREHRYFFKLYALVIELNLPAGSTKVEVEKAMKGHVIAEAKLMGRYNRSQKY